MNNPTPEEIKAARKQAGLTQEQAAALVYVKRDAWIRWEKGIRKMLPGMWELFTIKIKGKNKMKLQADNINGVRRVEEFDGVILSQQNFYDSLKDNPDDSIICAEVDEEMAARIDKEYGIH